MGGAVSKRCAWFRVRHAQVKLTAAVETGRMSQVGADAKSRRLEGGEHPQGLRALLGRDSSEEIPRIDSQLLESL